MGCPDEQPTRIEELAEFIPSYLGTGRENARTGASLAAQLGASKRDIQAAIQLLTLAGEPIGSSSSGGYWYCTSAEEALPVYAELVGRIRNQAARAKKWRERFPKLKELDQLTLEFVTAPPD